MGIGCRLSRLSSDDSTSTNGDVSLVLNPCVAIGKILVNLRSLVVEMGCADGRVLGGV